MNLWLVSSSDEASDEALDALGLVMRARVPADVGDPPTGVPICAVML